MKIICDDVIKDYNNVQGCQNSPEKTAFNIGISCFGCFASETFF